jgi:hypothetical protein
MLTLSLVIEDRDEYGDLRAYHKHEVPDPRAIVEFCDYLVRSADVDDTDMANAAGGLIETYIDAWEEYRRLMTEELELYERAHAKQVQIEVAPGVKVVAKREWQTGARCQSGATEQRAKNVSA